MVLNRIYCSTSREKAPNYQVYRCLLQFWIAEWEILFRFRRSVNIFPGLRMRWPLRGQVFLQLDIGTIFDLIRQQFRELVLDSVRFRSYRKKIKIFSLIFLLYLRFLKLNTAVIWRLNIIIQWILWKNLNHFSLIGKFHKRKYFCIFLWDTIRQNLRCNQCSMKIEFW